METDNLEERIIKAVSQNRILYDTDHPQYRDNALKCEAWKQIGIELDAPGEFIRHKWRSLRDCYRKALIKRYTHYDKGRFKPWRFDEDMAFLKPFFGALPGVQDTSVEKDENYEDSNDNEDEVSQDSLSTMDDQQKSQSPVSWHSLTGKTRSNRKTRRASEKPYRSPQAEDKCCEGVVLRDHLASFFKSTEDTVRTFIPLLQIEAKARISALVFEYEMKNLPGDTSSSQDILS